MKTYTGWQSNQLFRVNPDAGFEIEKYSSDDASWLNYGELAGKYPCDSNLFLYDNTI